MYKRTIAALLLSAALPLPLMAQDTATPDPAQDANPAVQTDMNAASDTNTTSDTNTASDTNTTTDTNTASDTNATTDTNTASDTNTMPDTNTASDTNATDATKTEQTAQTTQTAPSGDTFVTVPESGAWRVSDLEGKPVYTAEGESIGDIKDVLVSQDGSINAVLIGVGGFLGIGEKVVAVSMSALEFGPGMTAEEVNEAAAKSTNPAVSNETTADGTLTAPADNQAMTDNTGMATDPATADPAMDTTAATPADPAAQDMASNSAVQVGDDALPNRIVLNVTREQLESAPAFEGVKPAQ